MSTELIINIKNRPIRISVGSKLTLNRKGYTRELGKVGDVAKVVAITRSSHLTDSKLSVVRLDGPHPGWSNLSGDVPNGTGLYFYLENLIQCFDFTDLFGKVYISEDLIFKNRNLLNLNCKVLATLPNDDYFVEFEEDVGGCSCDGLGKKGRCIAVSKEILAERKKSAPKKKKKKESQNE